MKETEYTLRSGGSLDLYYCFIIKKLLLIKKEISTVWSINDTLCMLVGAVAFQTTDNYNLFWRAGWFARYGTYTISSDFKPFGLHGLLTMQFYIFSRGSRMREDPHNRMAWRQNIFIQNTSLNSCLISSFLTKVGYILLVICLLCINHIHS